MAYPFKNIEPKWQNYWDKNKTFRVTEDKKSLNIQRLQLTDARVSTVNYHRQSRWLWFAINGLPQTAASRVAPPPIVISKCRPLCGLHSPYKTFLRYFGINTMWYVQSHFVCAELSSCIFVSCVLSEMRCYRFSTLPQETFSCLITIRVKRFAAPQAQSVDFFWN